MKNETKKDKRESALPKMATMHRTLTNYNPNSNSYTITVLSE